MEQEESWKKESQFGALGTDGQTYKVFVMRQYTRAQYTDGSWSEPAPGKLRFSLLDRREVFAREDGTYQVKGTAVVLTKLM